jgi:hypothetical protein
MISAAYGVAGRLDGRRARRGLPLITLSEGLHLPGGRMGTML